MLLAGRTFSELALRWSSHKSQITVRRVGLVIIDTSHNCCMYVGCAPKYDDCCVSLKFLFEELFFVLCKGVRAKPFVFFFSFMEPIKCEIGQDLQVLQ